MYFETRKVNTSTAIFINKKKSPVLKNESNTNQNHVEPPQLIVPELLAGIFDVTHLYRARLSHFRRC